MEKQSFLTAKLQLGSAKLPSIDYPIYQPKDNKTRILSHNSRQSDSNQQIINSSSSFETIKVVEGKVEPQSSSAKRQLDLTATYMSETMRRRRQDIIEYKRLAHQDDKTKSWNKSTKPDDAEKPIISRKMENFVHDRSQNFQYNYRAETLDPLKNLPYIDKSTKFHISLQTLSQTNEIKALQKQSLLHSGYQHRIQELPVHQNLEYSKPWDCTTTVLSSHDRQVMLLDKTSKAKEWTKRKNKALGASIPSDTTASRVNAIPYIDPVTTQNKLQETIREMKRQKRFTATTPLGTMTRTITVDHSKSNDLEPEYEDDLKKTGFWKFKSSKKSYSWSDDASLRPVCGQDGQPYKPISATASMATYND